MPRSRLAISLSLLVLTGTLAFAQQGLQALYDGALQEFRAGSLAEAARLFEQFRTVAPEDDKADDALWYIGRALAGLGRQESWKN